MPFCLASSAIFFPTTFADATPSSGQFVFALRIDRSRFKHPEAYEIAQQNASRVEFTGSTSQAVTYAVFDFLVED